MRIGTLRHSGRRSGAAILFSLAGLLSGCAIHPLPEDVARLDTIEIVEHIRCEMYDALRHQVVIGFQLSDSEAAHQVAREIEDHPDRSLKDFLGKVELLKSEYKNRFGAFRGTTIGYGFRFNITEQDVATADLNFGLPWNPLANFGLRTAAGIDKRRANTRRFFKVETFEELLLSNDCLGKTLNEANIVYPITGKIGLRKTVEDFIKLTTRGAKTLSDSRDVKNFSEQLTFLTELSGSVTPSVKLAPVTDQFKLANASGELSARRTDIHELTLTFDVSKDFDVAKVIAGQPARRDAVIKELNTLRFLDAVERGGGAVIPQQ